MCAKSDYGKRPSGGWSRAYELAWLRLHGEKCPDCNGTGIIKNDISCDLSWNSLCERCLATGYIKQEKK